VREADVRKLRGALDTIAAEIGNPTLVQ
jgi:hypothetical protein